MASAHLQASGALAALFGFITAASLWWAYFDFSNASPLGRGRLAPQTYTYGHLLIVAGITAAGVGTLLAIRAHGATLAPGARWALCGGTAAFLTAISAIQLVNARAPRDSRIWIRLTAALLLAVMAGAGSGISAHALTIGVASLMVAALLAEGMLGGPAHGSLEEPAHRPPPEDSGAREAKPKSTA